MNEYLSAFLQDLALAFSDPQKRVFWGYLAVSLIIALVWLRYFAPAGNSLRRHLLNREIWCSASARADYVIFLLNRLGFLLLAPLLLAQITLAAWLFESLYTWLGYRPVLGVNWPNWVIMACFSAFYFLLDDFSRFYLHKLLHEVPCLWAVHKMHHSARVLTPMTVFRTHPLEALLFSLRTTLVQAISIALFVFFFAGRADIIELFGVSITVLLFNLMGSNLRHSHIGLGYWAWLERWLISPAQHQIHHSVDPLHFNKNYGVVLSFWDRINGSLMVSKAGQDLAFGLGRQMGKNEQKLFWLYAQPLVELKDMLLALPGKILRS